MKIVIHNEWVSPTFYRWVKDDDGNVAELHIPRGLKGIAETLDMQGHLERYFVVDGCTW